MSGIAVAGAGAFGTALAVALAREDIAVHLLARTENAAADIRKHWENRRHLTGIRLPPSLAPTSDARTLAAADTVLLAVPTQALRGFLKAHALHLSGKACVLCCKGIEKGTGCLPSEVLADIVPGARIAVLTGPGFASEIARGLPTALTLATTANDGADLQQRLSTRSLRLYLSNDPVGAQLGGALKNVIAIACGIAMGAGLGESARAALLTRGYSEMLRLAVDLGAKPATLSGLSGLGDLALTCTSAQSRNYSLGLDLGRGGKMADGPTFEGVATARATLTLADPRGISMPIADIVARVLENEMSITEAVAALLSRPLKQE